VQLCLNPAFGKNPKKAMDEFLRSRRFDPTLFDYTDEEKQQLAQQPPPPMPQIEVAKIRAEADLKKAEMSGQVKQLEIKTDTDRDTAWVQAETERTRVQHEAKIQELMLKKEIALLEYALEQKIALDSVKAQLAAKAADINLERELAGAANAIDVKKHNDTKPPLEPAQRAPNGQAWSQ
jgi:hypothetical protein